MGSEVHGSGAFLFHALSILSSPPLAPPALHTFILSVQFIPMHNCGYANCPGPDTAARQHIKIRDPLANLTRYRLYHLIRDNPGIGQRQASELLEVCPNTITYHAGVLMDFDLINAKRAGTDIGYYPSGMAMTPAQIKTAKLNPFETAVLSLVRERPGVSQREVVIQSGGSQPRASMALKKLAGLGLLTAQKLGRSVFYNPV